MALFKKILFYLFVIFSVFLIIITFISLFNSTFWYLKILNFPRLQILVALVVCLVMYFFYKKKKNTGAIVWCSSLAAAIIIQAYVLFPYSSFAGTTVPDGDINTADTKSVVSIIVVNVLMKNRNADSLLRIIYKKNPTFVLAMEVDNWWVSRLDTLNKNYPFHVKFPTANTYGMSLYSKLPLHKKDIYFFNHDSVPSFYAKVTLPNNVTFQLLTIHPVAPKPSKHPDNVEEEEKALDLAAGLIAGDPIPAIVAGDFNDVGWSNNCKQFQNVSKLNDVRRGRGFYNTFDANSLFFRWPLDYVFVSRSFALLKVERLPAFGSDHFPYYVQLALHL